jgi:UPF0755 protein
MIRILAKLFVLGLVVVIAAGGYLAYTLSRPYQGYTQPVLLDLPPGTSTRAMARMLTEKGVLAAEWPFLAAKALQPGRTLQAGEYQFKDALSPWQVFAKIARGEVFYWELRIPEGYNLFDIGQELERQGIMKAAAFTEVAKDPAMIRDLAPDAPSLEGYLFPATYRLTRRTTAKQLAAEMVGRFKRSWKSIAREGADVHDTVTLASLVEKETGVPTERGQVSSVFHNRLARNMTLDCDPTVIYGALLENKYRGTIYRSNLESLNPYNTYRHAGLPPGPIANPGLASLKAALEPAETDYLFFVAKPDGSGGHEFASTLSDHNDNVAAYRRGQASQRQ